MAAYTDFVIEINAAPRGYTVRATAPAGKAQNDAALPLSPLELENRLQAVELSLLRGRGGLRRALSENERQAQELGTLLFDFLFSGDVRALFDLSRLQAEQAEGGLRLLLTVEPPELAALPWELLYRAQEGEFLALSQATPVIRRAAAPYAQNRLTVAAPLRVLGVVAAPDNWEPLDIPQEKQRLEDALAPLGRAGLAELVWLEGQTRRDLQAAMRAGPWHAIHFIGHGGFDRERDEGFIVLCDETDAEARLHAVELARLVADHPSLRLVFLNACEGATAGQGDDLASSAAALVRRSVPAVVAMQYPISDSGAIEFARTFYESLADGLPVEAAVTDARKSVSLAAPHSPEWATPVLFLAAQDSRLFSLEKAVDVAPPPPPSLPVDEAPPAGRSGTGISRLLWFFALLTVLAVVLWQVWPRPGEEAAPPPATSAVASVPDAAPTPFPTIDEAEYQAGMATAMAAETATAAASSAAATPDASVLLHVTFDSPASIEQPLAGTGGATNLPADAFVEGDAGTGAAIDQRYQFVRFPAEGTISLEAGEIELRYRPNFDYGDNPPPRNEHALVVVGDVYNPPHLLLMMSDRLRIVYRADWEQDYFAESVSPALPWTQGDWLHIRAVWDRSSPDAAFQLHVNDVRVDVTRSGGGWLLPTDGQADVLWIGSGGGDLEADGVIDELIIRGPGTGPTTVKPTPAAGARLQLTLEDADSIRAPVAGPGGVTTLPASVFVPGRVGNGLRFGGERGVVAFPLAGSDPPPIDFAQGEIEFWYQPDYDHDPASEETHALVNAGDWYARTQLRLAVIGRLYFSIFDDSSTSLGTRTSLTRSLWKAGEWVHIRAVWDASRPDDPIQLYINHERVDTDPNLRAWDVSDERLPETLYIGGASDEGILPADGIIDELIIRAAPDVRPVAAQVAVATPLPTPTPVSGWQRLGESGPEIDGWVYALAVTDETVYIGGSFKSPSPGLLTWNRRTGDWGTLGAGFSGAVQTLLVDGPDLYAGGDFSVAGADGETIRGLARWDGEKWNAIGGGLSGLNRGPVAGVAALALDADRNLYVGGIFSGAGNGDGTGVSARGILRWNRALARWERLGGDDDASGLVRFSGDSQPVFVAALEVVGDYLYVGGHFAAIADRNGGSFPDSTNFARWHIPTEVWEGVGRVGSNSGYSVYALAADGDDIYVGGDFDTVYDEAGTPINAVLLARWNATSREWGGICCINDKDYGRTLSNGLVSYGTIGVVRALVQSEKGLYVAGRFNEAGDQTVNNVARYRNGSWARLTMRTAAGATVAGVNDTIFALAPANDEWIVGGKFTEFGEIENGSGLARWGE